VWVVPDEAGAALLFADDGAGGPSSAEGPIARVPLLRGASLDDGGDGWTADRQDLAPDDEADAVHHAVDDEWDAATAASFGRAWRGESDPHDEDEEFHLVRFAPERAVLLGSLRDRGWAALLTADRVLVPSGPLRTGHLAANDASRLPSLLARLPIGPWREADADPNDVADPSDNDGLPGIPVQATVHDLPVLPVLAATPTRLRATGLAAMVAAMAGAPAALVLLDLDWFGRAMVAFGGGSVLVGGVARALQHVRLTHSFLEVTGAWRVEQVPWERLHGVRRDGSRLAIAWEPDMVAEVGPFQAPECTPGQAERAEQLGAMMLRLRERALVIGARGRPTSGRPGPAWPFVAAYSALVGVALWTVLIR
jgi:hypothetical protein